MTRGDARRRDAPRGRCDAYTPLSLSCLFARSLAHALSLSFSYPSLSRLTALLFSLPLAPSPLHALFDRRLPLSLLLTRALPSFSPNSFSFFLSSTYLSLSRSFTCLKRLSLSLSVHLSASFSPSLLAHRNVRDMHRVHVYVRACICKQLCMYVCMIRHRERGID